MRRRENEMFLKGIRTRTIQHPGAHNSRPGVECIDLQVRHILRSRLFDLYGSQMDDLLKAVPYTEEDGPVSDQAIIHEHAFADERPFPQCHASTLVELAPDRFGIAYFAGTRERDPDVGIWFSERTPQGWLPPRLLAKINDQAHWNPVLFRSPVGPLLLYFKVGPRVPAWRTWMMQSQDNGHTWSEPRELLPTDPVARGPVKNKPIVLHNGTVLAPGSDERNDRWRPFVDISHDGGQTFIPGNLLPITHSQITGKGVIQPTLWESQPGHVHMLLRSTCGRICRADSSDSGCTWSSIYPTHLPNNNSGFDCAVLDAQGALALVYNPVAGDPENRGKGPRTPLSIALSFDHGLTWPRRLDLETDAGGYAYPAIIPTGAGMAISYTWRRERIAFWKGPITAIPALPHPP